MKKLASILFLILYGLPILAQPGFLFKKDVNRVSIPFQLINNLVFIPLQVNGVELTFLLDSGVEETVLFSLEDKQEVDLKNTETISLRGLGSADAIEGLKSTGNILEIKEMQSRNHLLYIILDQEFNLSSHIGIPVNGIIGYSFFKNHLLEINYQKKRIYFHKERVKKRNKIERRYNKIPISIERAKPYVNSIVVMGNQAVPVKLLVDIGNSDAVWLFDNVIENIKVPERNFDDYLGKGFSGDVLGKRAIITEFQIGDFKFERPIAAFPDSISLKHVKMVSGRLGSVGGEIFKRFSVIFDYKNSLLYLKKNGNYKNHFTYNKSGIEIRHTGMQWVKETVHLQMEPKSGGYNGLNNEAVSNNFKYKFQLKPVYEISNLRKNSPAANSGLREGDILITVNNKSAHSYTLQQINSFLKSEDEKWITLEVERDSQLYKFRFKLINIL
ncbi:MULTISPECIES: aspartyl protease family protein [unclassified Flavobacterium]|uniref:retropepsin-like aspartic protease n=1 Tax=unclassified Flavobacterium TaxID=196869 RepID=UPI003F921D4A